MKLSALHSDVSCAAFPETVKLSGRMRRFQDCGNAAEPVEGKCLSIGFGEAEHYDVCDRFRLVARPVGSASKLTTRRIIRSLAVGALSATSRVSAVNALGLIS